MQLYTKELASKFMFLNKYFPENPLGKRHALQPYL